MTVKIKETDVGSALFQSDRCPKALRVNPELCRTAASTVLHILAMRAHFDAPVEIDLGARGVFIFKEKK